MENIFYLNIISFIYQTGKVLIRTRIYPSFICVFLRYAASASEVSITFFVIFCTSIAVTRFPIYFLRYLE